MLYINVYMAGKGITDRNIEEIYPLIGSGNAEMVRTRSTLLIQTEDFSEFQNRFPMLLSTFQTGFRSIMNVPLFSKGRIIGGLLFRSVKPYAYTDKEVRLAERVGSQIAGAIANAQLFTEQKRTEAALRESEDRYRDLVEHSQDLICTHNLEGQILSMNRASERLLGYDRDTILKMNIRDILVPEVRDGFESYLNEIKRYEVAKGLMLIQTKTGERRILEYNNTLRTEGVPAPIVRSMAHDITERKQAEKEKRALEEQLRQSQKMEAIGQLAGGVAHDFNNLLTVIHGYSDLILKDLDEKSRLFQDMTEIKKASEHAASLTRQLLAFSRKQVFETKITDINNLVLNVDKMLRRMIGEDIELVSLLAEDLGRLKADPGQIEQVILNLAVNARDAMPKGGKLTIETANAELDEHYARSHVGVKPGRYVMLSVSDTGGGITPEIKEKIFEPFFTTKEQGKGTGLGLSTVYGIVKQSGGNIWVYSELNQGTTFKIYLPMVEEITEALQPKATSTKSLQGSETILLVEDEEAVRKLASTILQKNGYKVLEAGNGEEALRIAYAQPPQSIDLLLTDVVMPGMSGSQLKERAKSIQPIMKVLYMSGYTDNAIVHHGILGQGTAYIQKPFVPNALVSKIREVLDSPS